MKTDVYIKYLDCKNKFKETKKIFNSYGEAEEWGKANLEKWNPDFINYV